MEMVVIGKDFKTNQDYTWHSFHANGRDIRIRKTQDCFCFRLRLQRTHVLFVLSIMHVHNALDTSIFTEGRFHSINMECIIHILHYYNDPSFQQFGIGYIPF